MTPNTVQPITDEQLAEIEIYAKSASQYAEDDWFALDVFNTMFSPDDAQYLAASTPWIILALIARLRAAEKDQARYLWLREQGESFQWYNITRVDPDDFASLDDCIDAAMHQG